VLGRSKKSSSTFDPRSHVPAVRHIRRDRLALHLGCEAHYQAECHDMRSDSERSEHLELRAVQQCRRGANLCFWISVAVPGSSARDPKNLPGPALAPPQAVGEAGSWQESPGGKYVIDGSCTSSDPHTRRVGWGLAAMARGGTFGEMRGGVFVAFVDLACLVTHAAVTSDLGIFIHCRNVGDAFNREHCKAPSGPNQDLLAKLRSAMDCRTGLATVTWMKAHPKAEDIAK